MAFVVQVVVSQKNDILLLRPNIPQMFFFDSSRFSAGYHHHHHHHQQQQSTTTTINNNQPSNINHHHHHHHQQQQQQSTIINHLTPTIIIIFKDPDSYDMVTGRLKTAEVGQSHHGWGSRPFGFHHDAIFSRSKHWRNIWVFPKIGVPPNHPF